LDAAVVELIGDISVAGLVGAVGKSCDRAVDVIRATKQIVARENLDNVLRMGCIRRLLVERHYPMTFFLT
jgi:hypothetical protein